MGGLEGILSVLNLRESRMRCDQNKPGTKRCSYSANAAKENSAKIQVVVGCVVIKDVRYCKKISFGALNTVSGEMEIISRAESFDCVVAYF